MCGEGRVLIGRRGQMLQEVWEEGRVLVGRCGQIIQEVNTDVAIPPPSHCYCSSNINQ